IVAGPVWWFAEASQREGLTRYASLVGSLTAYGVYGSFALPIIYFLCRNKYLKVAGLIFVVAGLLVTLQKAAIANLVIFLLLLIITEPWKVKVSVLIGICVGL